MTSSNSREPHTGARASMGGRHPMAIGRIEKAQDTRQALARLVAYLAPFRTGIIVVLVFVVIYTLLGLLSPYLIGFAIDQYIIPNRTAELPQIALLMLAVYLVNNLFQALAGRTMARVSQRALQQLRQDLFRHLQTLPMQFFDRNPAGQLMSRLTNDIDAINQAVSQNVTALVASVLSLIGILVAMFVLDVWLALASLFVVPIMFWFTQFVATYTRRGFRELQRSMGELNAVMEEAISGQKVVKAFGRNESVLASFVAQNEQAYNAGVTANNYALLLMPLTSVLGNFFIIVLAAFGGWLALRDLVTVGVIATFIIYAQNFINPLRQLANMYNAIQGALAGAERVFEIMDIAAEVDIAVDVPVPQAIRGDVVFQDVQFAYEAGTPILRSMSMHAKAGQLFALVGPTGAGKTTIINLLSRFYEINAGSIHIDGVDIRDIPKEWLRRQLGLVLQDTFLFSDTVLENIRFGRLDATDEECMRAAEMADADSFIRQLPHGYQTMLSERANNLSQGQRQLLAIARMMLANPRILILDEATSSIDTRTEVRIQRALLRLMAGRTSFVIAHRLSTIRDADQVLVINGGEIVERGTHDELLAQHGLYHHLYISQFKGQHI
jgi:ATP-binding cassette subfamily B multidrug efflux pump